MTLDAFRNHCLLKKGVTEETPFGDDTLVFKVCGKMFAITGIPDFESVNLKVDPEKGAELRERYGAVTPGYHMNKKHWITVLNNRSIPDRLLMERITESYRLVASKLSRRDKLAIGLKD